MVIRQGDLYWIDLGEPLGSEPAYLHPSVVIQNDLFNQSEIGTTIVCSLTSNLRRGLVPGNVELDAGEGGLPKRSIVIVSQIYTIDKRQLTEYIGMLSKQRVRQILEGIKLLTEPHNAPR